MITKEYSRSVPKTIFISTIQHIEAQDKPAFVGSPGVMNPRTFTGRVLDIRNSILCGALPSSIAIFLNTNNEPLNDRHIVTRMAFVNQALPSSTVVIQTRGLHFEEHATALLGIRNLSIMTIKDTIDPAEVAKALPYAYISVVDEPTNDYMNPENVHIDHTGSILIPGFGPFPPSTGIAELIGSDQRTVSLYTYSLQT